MYVILSDTSSSFYLSRYEYSRYNFRDTYQTPSVIYDEEDD